MPGSHSPRGPSGAHRWRKCAASIQACADLPDTAGEEAIQGTVFHEVAALCLEFGIEGWGFIDKRIEFIGDDGEPDWRPFTKEMCVKMLPGLDLMWALENAPGAEMFVEQRVNLEEWIGPDEFGTSDAFIINLLQRKIVVFDWKWGAGVVVGPEWNDQGMLYALGVWSTFARDIFEEAGIEPGEIEVEIIIEQPRAPGGGGSWKVPLKTLLAEGAKIRIDALATEAEDPEYNPGPKQCEFCSAARLNVCKARSDQMLELLGDDVDDELAADRIEIKDEFDLRDARALTPEQRGFILLNRSLIEKWLQQLHDETMDDAKHGLPTPGQKRVPGRAGRRKWRDDNKATYLVVDKFGENAWTKKLLSPTQVEDEVGKKAYGELWARHVVQADGNPILVPEDDPRPAIKSTSEMLDEMWDETDETDSAEALI